MKKYLNKIMLIAFVGITMLGIASCNTDDPENELLLQKPKLHTKV